jgi:hypothetical protein
MTFKKIKKSEKKILFTESSPIDILAKIANIIKRRGYETYLTSITKNLDSEFLEESCIGLIKFNTKK